VPSVAHLLDLSLLMGNHRGLLVFAVLRWLWQAGSRWATTTRQFTSVAQYLVVAKSKSEDLRAELAESRKPWNAYGRNLLSSLKRLSGCVNSRMKLLERARSKPRRLWTECEENARRELAISKLPHLS
jgi:hypothetical protein